MGFATFAGITNVKEKQDMKVKELIELLQAQDPEAIVVVDGPEAGYRDLARVEILQLGIDSTPKWYFGKYIAGGDIKAVYLPRE